MAAAVDLAKMVPGFEFLQTLMKGATQALPGMPGLGSIPGMSQWITPTLDPEELDKRIQELKTVQFWLEQNARLLATTIQALEVQRMTLSTLQTMNLPLENLRDALKINLPASAPRAPSAPIGPQAPAPLAQPAPAADIEPEAESATPAAPAPGKPAAPAVDPLQWWGALTQQFTELATTAVKDSAADAAKALAGATVKPALKPAGKPAVKKTASAASTSAGTPLKTSGTAARPAAAKAPKRAPARKRSA